MSLEGKPLEALVESDLLALNEAEYAESKVIDYKRELPGGSDSARKEFLADVASFANTAGGHLVFGMEEEDGVPTAVCGLGRIDLDGVVGRLENMLRDGVRPRLQVQPKAVSLTKGEVALVLRIPRSWLAPHQITFQQDSRFYGRNSNGKYRLDGGELRVAFGLAESFAERARGIRLDRVNRIVNGETPCSLKPSAKAILHLMPLQALSAGSIDVAKAHKVIHRLHYAAGAHDVIINFDGPFICGPSLEPAKTFYRQVLRSGVIEWVDTYLLEPSQGALVIPGVFEEMILAEMPKLIDVLREIGVDPPVACMLTLTGVRGYTIEIPRRITGPRVIDRDILMIPEVIVEDLSVDLARTMRPMFDAVWNAVGFAGSINYDSEGKRR